MRRVIYKNEKVRFLLRPETLKNVNSWLENGDKKYSCPMPISCIKYFERDEKLACFMWFNEWPDRIEYIKGAPPCPCQFLGEEEVINWVLWQIQQDENLILSQEEKEQL